MSESRTNSVIIPGISYIWKFHFSRINRIQAFVQNDSTVVAMSLQCISLHKLSFEKQICVSWFNSYLTGGACREVSYWLFFFWFSLVLGIIMREITTPSCHDNTGSPPFSARSNTESNLPGLLFAATSRPSILGNRLTCCSRLLVYPVHHTSTHVHTHTRTHPDLLF